jgi:signal transduction histidine kinase
LVIALQHRFKGDLFFRTTVFIVGLQAALAIVLVLVFAATLHYTNLEVGRSVVAHVAEIIASNGQISAETLTDSISGLQSRITFFAFAGIVILATLSGIVLSQLTLLPARNSLESQKLFVSNIAHELRTPLSVIKTLVEVETLDEKLSSDSRKLYAGILEEVERASGVINNLLSLNRLLRPERMEFGNVDLGPIADRVVARRRKLAAERDIEIIIKKADYCCAWGNAVALEQIVANLINNAIEYTQKHKNGKVTVTIEPDYAGMLVLSVADTGIGITRQDLFHIFEPFYRADKSRMRSVKQGGSGLGLAIVNEIVRVHHGKVRVQSAPKKGTRVDIYLPVGQQVLMQNGTPAENREQGLNEVSVDFSKNNGLFTQDSAPTR